MVRIALGTKFIKGRSQRPSLSIQNIESIAEHRQRTRPMCPTGLRNLTPNADITLIYSYSYNGDMVQTAAVTAAALGPIGPQAQA